MELNQVKLVLRLKEVRLSKGFTQESLAEAIGMSQNNYGMIERGLISLSLENLVKISSVLQTPISYFLQDSMETMQESDLDKQLAQKFQTLNDDQKKLILHNMENLQDFCQTLIHKLL